MPALATSTVPRTAKGGSVAAYTFLMKGIPVHAVPGGRKDTLEWVQTGILLEIGNGW